MSELKQLIRDAIWRHTGSPLVEDYAESVIKAIEASGRVTVDRARFERLLDAANMAADEWGAESRVGLQPGDLDPLP